MFFFKKLLPQKHLPRTLVDRWFPSSKTCSNCGNKKPELKLSQRVFHCDQCDFEIDRDLNAAINIEREGIRLLA